MINMTTDD